MDLIFEAPWWLYVVPAVVGLGLAVAGRRRGDKTLRNVGVGLFLVGLAVFAAGRVVETDQEKVVRQSRELVAAVERRDWGTLSGLLTEDAVLSLQAVGQIHDSRDKIIAAAKSRMGDSKVTAVNVGGIDPKREGSLITTELQVYVTAEATGDRPIPTTWRLVWTRAGDGWAVRDIEAVQIGNIRGGDVRPWVK